MLKKMFPIFLVCFVSLQSPLFGQVNVSIPDTAIGSDTDLLIAILVDTLDDYNIISLDFDLHFDSNLLLAQEVQYENTIANQFYSKMDNLMDTNKVSFAGFGIFPVTGGDTLIKVLFHSTFGSGISPLTLDPFMFNEGDPTPIIKNGQVFVNVNPVPVELAEFSADVKREKIILRWTTLSEKNNLGFEVLRAFANDENSCAEELCWKGIGFVQGSGSTSAPHQYEFVDETLSRMNAHKFAIYRLKQIDTNGDFKFSPERMVRLLPLDFSLEQNYPNPFNAMTRIKFSTPDDGIASCKIYNVAGQNIMTILNKEKISAGIHRFSLDMSQFPAGVYFYELIFNGNSFFRQMRKMIYVK